MSAGFHQRQFARRPVFTREDEVTEFFDGKADIIFAGGTLGENTPVVAAREISKVYEEWLRGTAREVADNLGKRKKVQGEFVVVIGLPETEEKAHEEPDLPY